MKTTKNSNSWRFRGNELKYVKEVLDSGFGSSTIGTMNQRFEQAFAKRLGVRYAVTSNSGTATLHQALMAFGIGSGDEVIVPALTVVMCGYAVIHTGAHTADVGRAAVVMEGAGAVASNDKVGTTGDFIHAAVHVHIVEICGGRGHYLDLERHDVLNDQSGGGNET